MNSPATTPPTFSDCKVLVIAPGTTSRGGIVSVLRLHMQLPVWQVMQCDLLSTYSDAGAVEKIWAALYAYLRAPRRILRADIVHLHLAGQSSLLRKLPFALLAYLFRKPLIAHVHASSPESLFDATPNWAVRMILERADRVIALSESWAELIRTRLPEAQVQVIPNPVRIIHRSRPRVQRQPFVLFAGKLEERKGFLVLLQAAQIILRAYPDMQFWFAGHGEIERAKADAARLGISESVRLLGWVSHEELADLYRQASVFCLPSYNEGVPMSVLEAMSRGTPVVCTRVGGLPEFVRDGENGLFAEVGDSKSTAARILQFLDDFAFAQATAQAAKKTVQEKCGPLVIDKELRTLYRNLREIGRRHRATRTLPASVSLTSSTTP